MMMRRAQRKWTRGIACGAVILGGMLAACSGVLAQSSQPSPATTASAPADIPEDDDYGLLAGAYKDEANLFRFAPPVGSSIYQRAANSVELAGFVHSGKGWAGAVQSVTITDPKEAPTLEAALKHAAENLEHIFKGAQIIETRPGQKVSGLPAAIQIARGDVLAKNDAGQDIRRTMTRYLLLVQLPAKREVMIGVDRRQMFDPVTHEPLYQLAPAKFMMLYLFAPEKDAADAGKTFEAMVRRFEMLDAAKIRERRIAAMDAGRQWLREHPAETFKDKFTNKTQYFAMAVDGRQVGYVGITSTTGARDGYEGLLVTMATRTFPDPGSMIDARAESFWAYRAGNKKVNAVEAYYSCWSSSVDNFYLAADGKQDRTKANELGTITLDDSRDTPLVLDAAGKPVLDEFGAKKHAVPSPENCDTIFSITRTGDKRLDPGLANKNFMWKTRPEKAEDGSLPAGALPKVAEFFWPQMVDLKTPRSYAFVVFNAATTRLGLRTLTVGKKQDVKIEGKTVSAYRLLDELDPGSTTIYVDDKGTILKMKTSDGTELLPTTAEEMAKRWKHRLGQPGFGG